MTEIYLYGTIGSLGWLERDGDNTAARIRDELAEAAGGDVRLHVNSPGGDVFEGEAIRALLKAHDGRVEVLVEGLAASAASVVAMGGDEVVMSAGSMMMVHDPWTYASGCAAELRRAADTLDKVKESIVAAYAGKTGIDRARISDMMTAETWMTAEEAVAEGFADSVDDGLAVAACAVPPAIRAMYRSVPEGAPACDASDNIRNRTDTPKAATGAGAASGRGGSPGRRPRLVSGKIVSY